MKIQSGTVDGAITAGFSDSIADMPELIGAFLPMLLALPTQQIPDEMTVSLDDELPLANESEQHLPANSLNNIDDEANSPTASMELMAMLNAAAPLPVKPEIIDDKELSFSVADNVISNTPLSTQTSLPIIHSLPEAANTQDNAIRKDSSPVEFVLPDPLITEPREREALVASVPAMTLIKQSIATIDQKNPLPMILGAVDNSDLNLPRLVRGIQYVSTLCDELVHESRSLDPADKPRDVGAQNTNYQQTLALEPITNELQAMDGITPVVADKPSELNLCHTVLNTTVDFFNKQLITIDHSAPVAAQAAPNIAVDGQIMREKKIALDAMQFNPSQLTSLKSGNYSARLKVYPPDAGQITADILIHKGTTDLTLRCDNPGVKQFLESHLQPLRELFLQSTLQLGEVVIQHQSTGSEPSNQQPSHQSAFADYYAKQPETNALGAGAIRTDHQAPSSRSIIDTWV